MPARDGGGYLLLLAGGPLDVLLHGALPPLLILTRRRRQPCLLVPRSLHPGLLLALALLLLRGFALRLCLPVSNDIAATLRRMQPRWQR